MQIISCCVVHFLLFLNCRYFSSLQMQMFLFLNLRAGLVHAGTGPSVCPQGPESPAASTHQLCAWQMQKVSTKAILITAYWTIISHKLLDGNYSKNWTSAYLDIFSILHLTNGLGLMKTLHISILAPV